MDSNVIQNKLREDVSEGTRVTIETHNGKEIHGVVKSTGSDSVVINPNSGVVIDYAVIDTGTVLESRWDDAAGESAVQETNLGLIRDYQVME